MKLDRRSFLLGGGALLAGMTSQPSLGLAETKDFGGQYVSTTPLHKLSGTITPNNLAFIRNHAGVPEIHDDEHALVVHGLVQTPLRFTVADIKRFPQVSSTHFIECAGNSNGEWNGSNGSVDNITAEDTHGLVQNCVYVGASLRDILNEVGYRSAATWLMAEGADDAKMYRAIPMSTALDDCMVVYGMNGEKLPPEHGGPLRLLVPGCQGNVSIKWLRRLVVGDGPWQSREQIVYSPLFADGYAHQSLAMDAKSIITLPSPQSTVMRPGPNVISGLAWSGRGKITAVDVSIDGGQNWTRAGLEGPVLPKAFVRFNLPFDWKGQEMIVASRAQDETGYVQPSLKELAAQRGTNGFYHNNAIHPWRIRKGGEIESV